MLDSGALPVRKASPAAYAASMLECNAPTSCAIDSPKKTVLSCLPNVAAYSAADQLAANSLSAIAQVLVSAFDAMLAACVAGLLKSELAKTSVATLAPLRPVLIG